MRRLPIVVSWMIAFVSVSDADEPLCPIQVRLELSSTELLLADPVYARLTLKNVGDTDVDVLPPTRDIGTLRFDVHSDDHLAIRLWPDGEGIGSNSKVRLKPSEEYEVWDRLRLPRVAHLEKPFWNTEAMEYVVATVRITNELQVLSNPAYITLSKRPQKEIDLLLKTYNTKDTPEDQLSTYRATLNVFGLGGFPQSASKPSILARLDETLSPGTLKNVVRVTRLVQSFDDAENAEDRTQLLHDLTKWVDALPEIERHWLSKQIYDLGTNDRKAHLLDLAESFNDRIPDKMGSRSGLRQQRADEIERRRKFLESTDQSTESCFVK